MRRVTLNFQGDKGKFFDYLESLIYTSPQTID
jgi:hypothetical protein